MGAISSGLGRNPRGHVRHMYPVGEAMDSRMLPLKSEWMGEASVRGQAPQIQLARQSRAFCWSLDRPALAVPANLVACLPLDRGQVEW